MDVITYRCPNLNEPPHDKWKIYKIIYGLPWITILVKSRRMTKSRVKSIAELHHQDKMLVIHGNSCYFFHTILCPEHRNPLKTIIDRSFCHCCQERSFLIMRRDIATIDLWRQASTMCCYCDVRFVDCSCTRKFAQGWKENIKATRHWPLCGKFIGDQWIPRTNGQ